MTLICEQCGHSPSTTICQNCQNQTPDWASYCPFCGQKIIAINGAESLDNFDPSSRRLCPDGNCIGIIGPEDKCVICGRS